MKNCFVATLHEYHGDFRAEIRGTEFDSNWRSAADGLSARGMAKKILLDQVQAVYGDTVDVRFQGKEAVNEP